MRRFADGADESSKPYNVSEPESCPRPGRVTTAQRSPYLPGPQATASGAEVRIVELGAKTVGAVRCLDHTESYPSDCLPSPRSRRLSQERCHFHPARFVLTGWRTRTRPLCITSLRKSESLPSAIRSPGRSINDIASCSPREARRIFAPIATSRLPKLDTIQQIVGG